MSKSDPADPLDDQLRKLSSTISELSQQIDARRAKTAGALGSGVFLLLLAGLAGYDLAAGKSGVWLARGVTRDALTWIASGLSVGALSLLTLGFWLIKSRDHDLEGKLDQMEREYAELLERQKRPDTLTS